MLTIAELTKHVVEKRVMPPEAWGHPGWLSSAELLSLETLRFKASSELFEAEYMMGDRALLRFLRARKFDSTEAFKMLQKDLEWRRVFEGRVIRGQETPAVVDFCRQGFLHRSGFDKDGRPLLTIRFRYAFPRNIKDMNEIALFWVAYVQQVTDECEKLGKTDFSVIGDLDGFSPTSNFSLAMIKVLIDILQNHYPERLGFLLILNLPMAFRMGWNMIQPFLDERTKAKIHVLGKDAKLLKEYIPADQLEQHYGGTHAPYPYMDDFVEGMLASGIVVHTGFFPPQFHTADNAQQQQQLGGKKFSSTGLDRIRTIMLTPPQQQLGGEGVVKSNEVPKIHPRVAVFGANGKTGMEVVKRFLQHTQYDVVAFIRLHGSGVPPQMLQFSQQYGKERFSIIVGDCMNYNDLDRAIEMSDVVVSCMGATNRNGDGDAEFYEKTARALVDSMQRNGTKRLVVVTAAQAKRMSTAWWDSNATLAENSMRHLYWGAHFKHVAEMEKFIKNEHDIAYTFLRPAHLDDNISTSTDFVAEQDQFFLPGTALSRTALARCIVDDCVLANKYVNSGVALAGPATQ